MKKSRVENLKEKIEKKRQQLSQLGEKVKQLKTEITRLEKELEDAEMAELQCFMQEYNITPEKAKSIMMKLQEEEGGEESAEERTGVDSFTAGRL